MMMLMIMMMMLMMMMIFWSEGLREVKVKDCHGCSSWKPKTSMLSRGQSGKAYTLRGRSSALPRGSGPSRWPARGRSGAEEASPAGSCCNLSAPPNHRPHQRSGAPPEVKSCFDRECSVAPISPSESAWSQLNVVDIVFQQCSSLPRACRCGTRARTASDSPTSRAMR